MGQIRCDEIGLGRYDSVRQASSVLQKMPTLSDDELQAFEDWDLALEEHFWACHWDCQSRSYPERTGDLRSIVKISDFYSARQWHSTGMYCDFYRTLCHDHELQLCLPDPAAPGPFSGRDRTVRLYLWRGPGPDFPSATGRCSRCCARTCIRLTWTPSAAATPPPASPLGNGSCCACWPLGTPTPRSLAVSGYLREPCAPTWKTSTKGCVSPAAQPQ